MHFSKWQGCGNDVIIINGLGEELPDASAFAKQYSDRRFGIGFDQMLIVKPSGSADFKMLIINADGSEVEMCGNGIRCFAKYLHREGLTSKKSLVIETLGGTIKPKIEGELVVVDMGEPILNPQDIPVNLDQRAIELPQNFADTTLKITCVSMGNPHCVIFLEDIQNFPVTVLGPIIEHHPLFPKRTNVEFAQALDPHTIKVRVWERGTGETYACGTGACATLVAGVLTGHSEREATLQLKGGDLKIQWNETDNHVYMTGSAVFVYDGVLDV